MKLFEKRFPQEPEGSTGSSTTNKTTAESSHMSNHEKHNEYDEDSSFNWFGDDLGYGNFTTSLRGTRKEGSSADTTPVRTLAKTEEGSYAVDGDADPDATVPSRILSLCDGHAMTVDEDTGIDPYNSTRLKVTKQKPPGA